MRFALSAQRSTRGRAFLICLRKHKEAFSDWEAILSEVTVGDAFGADRIDYLLRDSLHAGVSYGRFDHFRLIDCLRILPRDDEDDSQEPTLGITEGGLHAAEALLLARYFMYMQLYFHPVRRVYDIHLRDFLQAWLPDGNFPVDVDAHIRLTDNEVWSALLHAARTDGEPGASHAERIVDRKHFRVLYSRNPEDLKTSLNPAAEIYQACIEEFGPDDVRFDTYRQKGGAPDFPVYCRDERVRSSLAKSATFQNIPVAAVDFVFICPEKKDQALKWLRDRKSQILGSTLGEGDMS